MVRRSRGVHPLLDSLQTQQINHNPTRRVEIADLGVCAGRARLTLSCAVSVCVFALGQFIIKKFGTGEIANVCRPFIDAYWMERRRGRNISARTNLSSKFIGRRG